MCGRCSIVLSEQPEPSSAAASDEHDVIMRDNRTPVSYNQSAQRDAELQSRESLLFYMIPKCRVQTYCGRQTAMWKLLTGENQFWHRSNDIVQLSSDC